MGHDVSILQHGCGAVFRLTSFTLKVERIRTIFSTVAILSMLLAPVDPVDATVKTWHSSPQFQASYERENSTAISRPFFGPPLSLPTIPDKPPRIDARLFAIGEKPGRPRVVETLHGQSVGNGSCVQYARSQGVPASGIARNVPTLAKNLGFRVDLQPEVGAAIVTTESSAGTNSGHVTGPIKQIDGNWAYQCEQNYRRGQVTCGWIDLTNPTIVAFIHTKS